jgi:mannose-1-phosphate guanylyltransferase/mannose-1-phosphate guanylyltransferase/phosphomannomutase
VNKAFVLGAGLGERLRPLTAQLPKPLIPFYHRPLICAAFDHVIAAGAQEIVVNTHHLPQTYGEAFPTCRHSGIPLHFRNESPDRLETAGGIANVRDLLDGPDSFLVYNGDILTDLPLAPLIAHHHATGNLVTLALRSSGPALHIAIDPSTGRLTDIHNKLGTGNPGTHLFTGIYLVNPAFFDWLTPGKKESVIPIFLKLIESGHRIGGLVLDEGHWWDLGNRTTYLDAHLARAGTQLGQTAIHPLAQVHPTATLIGQNIIGPHAIVEAGAVLQDSLLWPHAYVQAGTRLTRTIVRSHITAAGSHENADL